MRRFVPPVGGNGLDIQQGEAVLPLPAIWSALLSFLISFFSPIGQSILFLPKLIGNLVFLIYSLNLTCILIYLTISRITISHSWFSLIPLSEGFLVEISAFTGCTYLIPEYLTVSIGWSRYLYRSNQVVPRALVLVPHVNLKELWLKYFNLQGVTK